jgi:hypothetical protein
VLNLVTKVSDPHGSTVGGGGSVPDPDPATQTNTDPHGSVLSTDPGLRLDSSIRFPFCRTFRLKSNLAPELCSVHIYSLTVYRIYFYDCQAL